MVKDIVYVINVTEITAPSVDLILSFLMFPLPWLNFSCCVSQQLKSQSAPSCCGGKETQATRMAGAEPALEEANLASALQLSAVMRRSHGPPLSESRLATAGTVGDFLCSTLSVHAAPSLNGQKPPFSD